MLSRERGSRMGLGAKVVTTPPSSRESRSTGHSSRLASGAIGGRADVTNAVKMLAAAGGLAGFLDGNWVPAAAKGSQI